MNSNAKASRLPLNLLLCAGLAGGLAEMMWLGFYSMVAPLSGVEVARQITASVIPAAAAFSFAAVLGLIIHLLLSLLLGVAFGLTVWWPFARLLRTSGIMIAAVIALTSVWAFNFFVLLPALNPAFISLMPLAITLLSKVLFGLAMGGTLLLGHVPFNTRNGFQAGLPIPASIAPWR